VNSVEDSAEVQAVLVALGRVVALSALYVIAALSRRKKLNEISNWQPPRVPTRPAFSS